MTNKPFRMHHDPQLAAYPVLVPIYLAQFPITTISAEEELIDTTISLSMEAWTHEVIIICIQCFQSLIICSLGY